MIRALAEERLAFFGERLMGYRWDQPAYSLSYANRRRLEIARATATSPRLLLLDEPAAGMNPKETHEITDLIEKLRTDGGYTILVIEHDMHVVEGISDRVVALDHGDQDRRGHVRAGGDQSRRWSRRTSAPAGWRRSERRTRTSPRRRRSSSSRASTRTTGRSTSSRTRTSSSPRASSSACSAATPRASRRR